MTTTSIPVLEPAARAFADATANPPYLYDLGPIDGRKTVDDVQSADTTKPDVDERWITVPDGPTGDVSVRIVRPPAAPGRLPVVLYIHGAGWVFGNAHTHDRLVRELAVGTGAAVVFPEYSLSPEARYPTAIEQAWTVAHWIVDNGAGVDLDGTRLAVAGDSVGGNMAAALTLLAKTTRRTQLHPPSALLSSHRRGVRHRLLRPVRRGLLPAPRRDALVLGPIHHRPARTSPDHRVTTPGHD